MTKQITSALAMSHPTVVETIKVLAEMSQRLQDENDELKAALVQEPVAKYIGEGNEGSLVQLYDDVKKGTDFYTAPPKRPWVGLTDAEINGIVGLWGNAVVKGYTRKLFDQVEAKLKEKNT